MSTVNNSDNNTSGMQAIFELESTVINLGEKATLNSNNIAKQRNSFAKADETNLENTSTDLNNEIKKQKKAEKRAHKHSSAWGSFTHGIAHIAKLVGYCVELVTAGTACKLFGGNTSEANKIGKSIAKDCSLANVVGMVGALAVVFSAVLSVVTADPFLMAMTVMTLSGGMDKLKESVGELGKGLGELGKRLVKLGKVIGGSFGKGLVELGKGFGKLGKAIDGSDVIKDAIIMVAFGAAYGLGTTDLEMVTEAAAEEGASATVEEGSSQIELVDMSSSVSGNADESSEVAADDASDSAPAELSDMNSSNAAAGNADESSEVAADDASDSAAEGSRKLTGKVALKAALSSLGAAAMTGTTVGFFSDLAKDGVMGNDLAEILTVIMLVVSIAFMAGSSAVSYEESDTMFTRGVNKLSECMSRAAPETSDSVIRALTALFGLTQIGQGATSMSFQYEMATKLSKIMKRVGKYQGTTALLNMSSSQNNQDVKEDQKKLQTSLKSYDSMINSFSSFFAGVQEEAVALMHA